MCIYVIPAFFFLGRLPARYDCLNDGISGMLTSGLWQLELFVWSTYCVFKMLVDSH